MHMSYSSSACVVINASQQAVWDALTKPEQVKEYFFGTNLVTTWEVGTPIFFRGEWKGQTYEDKGMVLEYAPITSLSYNYWSGMSGMEDKPELYQVLRYLLEAIPEGTKLTIEQSNVDTQDRADHSAENWNGVLQGLKKYVEARNGDRAMGYLSAN